MRKDLAQELNNEALKTAALFSGERPKNVMGETFTLEKITPLSESMAAVVYRKNTGKFALALFYHVNVNGGEWRYFFPTDSHLLGMIALSSAKQLIEFANFDFNFSEVEQ